MADSVTIHIDGSTAGFRLATYGRSLGRPAVLLPLIVVGVLPLGVSEAVGLVAADDGMRLTNLLLGLGAVALLVALGALIAVARRVAPSTLTFDEAGIREATRRRTIEHGWAWLVDVVEDERRVTLYCRRPMRSFQLASSADQRTIVLDRLEAQTEVLLRLLVARALCGVRRA